MVPTNLSPWSISRGASGPCRQRAHGLPHHQVSTLATDEPANGLAAGGQFISANPLAAGSQLQLVAPVKLRPFKSAYHVRQGNQLRLVCQVQRGYPAAHISWYVGNRLVDGDFLREHANEYAILQLHNHERLSVTSSSGIQAAGSRDSYAANDQDTQQQQRRIVEINPIPSGRQQMQLTANGRGQWVEYREPTNEKYSIETRQQQLRYLQMKLAQLTGVSLAGATGDGPQPEPVQAQSVTQQQQLSQQASLSVLVINSLAAEQHTSRYACRATSRANTDEVTTVIRVKGE